MSVTTPLEKKIKARIEAQGPITLADYMAVCLFDPEHGYYRSGNPLGASGDFITAPDVSQIFGELIGLWCVDVWQSMGAPGTFRLVELGPGRGTLLADALRAAQVVPDFLSAACVDLVESNTTLRTAQETALACVDSPLEWHERMSDVPSGPTILIANEFFDALPVRQYVRQQGQWHERQIALDREGDLCFTTAENPSVVHIEVGDHAPDGTSCPDGSIWETRPEADHLVADFARRSVADPFAALIIDYGHVGGRGGDTVQGLSRHRHADIFDRPGEIDLTAHVDFARLVGAAGSAGLSSAGPICQRDLLNQLGIAHRLRQLVAGADAAQRQTLISAAERLIAPDQMGDLFKAVTLFSEGLPVPAPFTADNPTATKVMNGDPVE